VERQAKNRDSYSYKNNPLMCGICGIVNYDQRAVEPASIQGMMRSMKHRGPDDEGAFCEGGAGLGFVRLSVLDLSPAANQPMHSADGRYVLVYNGEIFNYLELREMLRARGHVFRTQTDSEVLLAAYLEWGPECLHRFNGMWALAIYDRWHKTVFIARDRYGIKPLYYLHRPDYFAFASEIAPLLGLLPGKPSPDDQSIFDYLVFNRTDQTERTFFREVKKLQHGCTLTIADSMPAPARWYDLRERVAVQEALASPAELRDLLHTAIGLRLRSDVPLGVCLSGGLDSSSIVALLLDDYQQAELQTFSAVYQPGQYGDERRFIEEFRPQLKHMHFTTPSAETLLADLPHFVRAHGEPVPTTGPYAQYKVMELAKGKVVVTLDGQGADEELAGYHYFFGFFFKDLLRRGKIGRLGQEVFHYLTKHRSLYGLASLGYLLLPERVRTLARVKEKGYLNPEWAAAYQHTNAIAGQLYGASSLHEALLDHFEYKLEHLLKWEDRNSMWFSLEARVPFLDYRLVEKVLATPGEQIIKNGMTKHLLREAMRGVVPEAIRLRRDKIGFGTPQDEWFRTPAWQELILDVLNSPECRERKLIDTSKALALYQQHRAGRLNAAREIWKWVHLEEWFRTFVD